MSKSLNRRSFISKAALAGLGSMAAPLAFPDSGRAYADDQFVVPHAELLSSPDPVGAALTFVVSVVITLVFAISAVRLGLVLIRAVKRRLGAGDSKSGKQSDR